jgi:hypothetical protein
MSGLYNMLMGNNPFIPYLFACIEVSQENADQYPLGRFRDMWVDDEGEHIWMLTRNCPGGFETQEAFEEVDNAWRSHPNFIKYEPDEDHTYAYYVFSVPEKASNAAKQIVEATDRMKPMDRYRHAMEQMGKGEKNAQTEHMKKVGDQLFKPIMDAIEGNESKDEVIENDFGSVRIISSGKKKEGEIE